MEVQPQGPGKARSKKRGFAGMESDKVRLIAGMGGRAAHARGRAHKFTRDEASEAGKRGGAAAHAKGVAHRFTSEEAREAGRKGLASRRRADGEAGEGTGP